MTTLATYNYTPAFFYEIPFNTKTDSDQDDEWEINEDDWAINEDEWGLGEDEWLRTEEKA